jgi:pyruvate dehydrogenase E1 component alpha subunit
MSSSVEEMFPIVNLSDRASAYDIPGTTIDGNDVQLVYDTVQQATRQARIGEGPMLIEAVTYRHAGHSKSDKFLYRTQEEEIEWKDKNDPIYRLEQKMLEKAEFDEQEMLILRNQAYQEVMEASKFAVEAPATSIDELMEHVSFRKEGDNLYG